MLRVSLPKVCILAGLTVAGWAQMAPPVREIPLYPGVAPGSENWNYSERSAGTADRPQAQNIVRPVLLYYPAEKANAVGTAMIVAPGGGHRFLSIDTEGTNVAEWLNSIGVAAFVLKYRLAREEGSPYKVEVDPYADAQRSIRMIRARAKEWGVDPARVGIMGFSAGGEVAALASTKFDAGKLDAADPIERQSSRPDFQILIYPGVQADQVEVSKETPPTFLLCADNDKGPSTAIPAVYLALKKAGVPAELHIYASGGHGFGYQPADNRPNVIYATWVARLQDWMADVGMSPAKQSAKR